MHIVKVSVIIPVYNVEKYLRQCLDSVVNQTLKDIEIILVDDGSTDLSLDICNEYAKKDARVKVFHQKNLGAGAARNLGLDKANGEYLSILDSDDYFELSMLEKLYEKAKNDDTDITICDVNCFDDRTKTLVKDIKVISREMIPLKNVFNYKDMPNYIFNTFQNWTWNKLFRTDFVRKNNIKFQHVFRTNDLFFTCSALMLANKISFIDKKLVNYRVCITTNCQSTNYKYPFDFYNAFMELKNFLLKNELYECVRTSYINWALCAVLHNLNSIKLYKKQYKRLYRFLLKEGLDSLDINESTKIVFYDDWARDNYMRLKNENNFYKHVWEIFFSLKNKDNHKVLTILGVKFKFKRKCKCSNKILNFKTVQNLTDLIRNKIFLIPSDIDLIVGIPRSGIIPAYLIALFLNKNVCSLNEFVNGLLPQKGERPIACSNKSVNKKKVLIVDDSIYSGNALQKTKEMLSHTDTDKYSYEYCCIYAKKETASLVDYYFEIVDPPRVFQWNYLNHSFANQCCFDMDGVLCVDPTNEQNDDGDKYLDFLINAKSLYIPAFKIHSVVTSRLEKYREQTEYWLKKNNVLYGNLYMLDLPSAAERQRLGCHAKFKADIFAQIKDCNCFIESDRTQAEFISKTTGKQCICVATDELFGGNNE